MKKTKLKIHTSHLVCGSGKMDLHNLKKLADIFFIKKYKGITFDISKFHSETIDVEYDEKSLRILNQNKTLKINEHDFVVLNINKQRYERGLLDVASQKAQVSIFSDYLTNYLFNSRVKFYKKILFRNYEQVKNLFFDYTVPEFLDVVYMKNNLFFANESFLKLELSNYFLNELDAKRNNLFSYMTYKDKANQINTHTANPAMDKNKTELKELEQMINEFYSLSIKNEDVKLKSLKALPSSSSNKSNVIVKEIKGNKADYTEFPFYLNHKNFSFYTKSENENLAIFELTINRIKEYNENIGLFYLDLKRLFQTFLQNPKQAFDDFNILKTEKKKLSVDEEKVKRQIVDLKNMFKDNRYKFRRNLMNFLNNEFNSQSPQLLFFIDSLVFTYNDYEIFCKFIEDFLIYIEDHYDIELLILNVNRKLRKP